MQPFHSRDLRKGRWSESGRAYLVTITTFDRAPLFAALPFARCVVHAMRRLHCLGYVDSLSFVVMPDHLHWLFVLNETRSLAACINAMKSMASRRIHALAPTTNRIWQRGFHDRALRRDEEQLTIARYVVANPLRAGLVNDVGQYPHWDAAWL